MCCSPLRNSSVVATAREVADGLRATASLTNQNSLRNVCQRDYFTACLTYNHCIYYNILWGKDAWKIFINPQPLQNVSSLF